MLGAGGEIQGYVKIASDISRRIQQGQRDEAILGALDRVMAVVEFTAAPGNRLCGECPADLPEEMRRLCEPSVQG